MGKKWYLLSLPLVAACAQGVSEEISYGIPANMQGGCTETATAMQEQTTSDETPKIAKRKPQIQLEGKVGYFFFGTSKMRKIYDEGGLDVQLCSSFPLCSWLQIYGSVEYMQKHGKSLNAHQKTWFWAVPLSLGLKPIVRINNWADYYITIGPRYVFANVHNRSKFVDESLSENGFGGFLNTGFNFYPMKHLLVDVFGEYSYVKLNFHPHKTNVVGRSTQVGGFVFGVGLGYAF